MLPTFSKNLGKSSSDISLSASQKPQDFGSESGHSVKKKRDIRTVLSVIIFIFTLLAAGTVFGLNFYLDARIANIERLLVQHEEDIQIATIESLIRFDQGIDALKVLIDSRAGYRAVIDAMASIIIPNVRYSSASIELNENEEYRIVINATARSLNAYRQQVVTIRSQEPTNLMRGVTIKNYTIEKGGDNSATVSFEMEIQVPVAAAVQSRNGVTTEQTNQQA